MSRSGAAMLFAALLGALGTGSDAAPRQAPSIRQRLAAVLAAEESRAAAPHQLDTLAEATRDSASEIQAAAARALGRLERRDVIPVLLPLLGSRQERVRSEAANAIAQSFRGAPSGSASAGLNAVLDALKAAPRSDGWYRAVGRLPYETAEQVRAAEALLREAILSTDPPASAARGLESLGRRRPRLAPLEQATVDRLREIAGRASARTVVAAVRRNAMLALVAWEAADAQTVEAALDDEEFEIRRLAALVLGGAGSAFTPEERTAFLNSALRDRAPQVRLEAIRSWTRRATAEHGCVPLLHALSDPDLHVVIAALDALGGQCRDDEDITERLAAEARTPPAQGGAWQREAHAFLSLARRSRERAAFAMSAFASHADWKVRLYAVRAAAAMDDLATLQRLATDPDDNVVEATLAPLRRRLGADSDALFIAALNRRARTSPGRGEPTRPYQVYREAALQLKGALGTADLLAALLGALQRASADRCDTSRDARLELVARIAEFGSGQQVSALTPLLRDIDPVVAAAAARTIEAWTGRRPVVEPPPRQPDVPPLEKLFEDELLAVEMENGRLFRMAFHAEQAPLAKARIMRLAGQRFYDGLTFHRVVPNFVIQGGSPNANEYCGDCPYMRDEVGLQMHVRGTVGISTRGRDTGDAQFFVNLVDSPRLDHEYTVFAYVCPADMPVVDRIQEGDRMARVSIVRGPRSTCPPPH